MLDSNNQVTSTHRETVRTEMRAWLETTVHELALEETDLRSLDDGTDLLADGVIDSFTMLELLTWLDERFGVFVQIADDDQALTRFGELADYVTARVPGADAV